MTELYNDAISLGQFRSRLQLAGASCVSVILLYVASYMLYSSTTTANGTATVTSESTCSQVVQNITRTVPSRHRTGVLSILNGTTDSQIQNTTKTVQECNTNISHFLSDKEYTGTIVTPIHYKIGDSVQITYDKSNPSNVYIQSVPSYYFALLSCICAIFIVVAAYINYYITTEYKLYAASTGASTVLGMAANAIKG